MKRVLITGQGPQHIYLANHLARNLGLYATVVDEGVNHTKISRIRQLQKRYTAAQLVDRLVSGALKQFWFDDSVRRRELYRVLGPSSRFFDNANTIYRVAGINTEASRSLVRQLEPDQILVFGTSIIGRDVLQISNLVPLNLHTGISPHYRGSSCSFWPIYDERFDMLGATVHECSMDVDGGKIYATGRAKLRRRDGLHSIFARCVEVGAELYVQVAKCFENGRTSGTEQDLTIGREYHARDRTVFAELRVRKIIREGGVDNYLSGHRRDEGAL